MPASGYVQPEGVATEFKLGQADILQLYSRKVFEPGHALSLLIVETVPKKGIGFSPKLMPLVVRLTEEEPDERNYDIYSFDYHGNCLAHTGSSVLRNQDPDNAHRIILRAHGYSQRGKKWVCEELDTSISRLVVKGETIKEMIGGYPVDPVMADHDTVMRLMNNTLDSRP